MQTIARNIGVVMMTIGVLVTGLGAWDGLNGPEASSEPRVVNPDQPVVIQPPEDELKPSDLTGPGLALVASGGAIAAGSAGVGAPAAVGSGQGEGQRPMEGQLLREMIERQRRMEGQLLREMVERQRRSRDTTD